MLRKERFITLTTNKRDNPIPRNSSYRYFGILAAKSSYRPNVDARRKGSGVLISKDSILTATHTRLPRHDMYIGLGATFHKDVYKPVAVPYLGEILTYSKIGVDVSLCKLATPVPDNLISPLPILNPNRIDSVTSVELFGYGYDADPGPGELYQLAKATANLPQFKIAYKDALTTPGNMSMDVYGSGKITDGDSGGGVLAFIGSTPYLAGIQTMYPLLPRPRPGFVGTITVVL